MSAIDFNGGDDVVLAFCLRDVNEAIVSLVGITLTAEVFERNRLVKTLTVGSGGIEIDDETPVEGEAHGVLNVYDQSETPDLPAGQLHYVKLKATDGTGYDASSEAIPLRKVLP